MLTIKMATAKQVVGAVRKVTRDSPYAAYASLLKNKKGAKKQTARKERAKSIANWKKQYPHTVRERVKSNL